MLKQVEFNKDTSKFEEPINGSYRDFCSYIKVLAELYIQVDQALGSESFSNILEHCPITLELLLERMALHSAKMMKPLHGLFHS